MCFCGASFVQVNTAELSFYTSHLLVVALHFFPLPSVLFIIRHLSIFCMLHPSSLSIWLCLWLPLIFPFSLCPLSLTVALLPNWLCNPDWISVSCCAWLNVCVCVCVRMVADCWSSLTSDTRAFVLGIQKLIAAPSLHFCTYPSSPTSHPSSSLIWYLLYDLCSCNGPSFLYLVFSHILCSSVLALFRMSLLTLYLKNSFSQCLQLASVIIHKTRSKLHKMLLPRTGQVIRHTLFVQHMLFSFTAPSERGPKYYLFTKTK